MRAQLCAPSTSCSRAVLCDPNYSPWWRKTVSAAGGDITMALLYNNFASPLVSYQSKVRDSIGCALIPGGRPVIGGGNAALSSTLPIRAGAELHPLALQRADCLCIRLPRRRISLRRIL